MGGDRGVRNPAADVGRIFEAFSASRAKAPVGWHFCRALAGPLVRDAMEAAPPDDLYSDAALVDGWRAQQILWDDLRPRHLHIWPDGDRWGDVPPRGRHGAGASYTACGEEIDIRFYHQRATRGEWRFHVDAVRKIEALRADPPPPDRWVVFDDPRVDKRLCARCLEHAHRFPECEDERKSRALRPDELEHVAAIAADRLGDRFLERPPATLATAQGAARRAYVGGVLDRVTWLMRRDGESALRRLFGEDLWRALGPEFMTKYDDLAVFARRLCRRAPHEPLGERDWRKLLAPYAPGGLGRKEARDEHGAPSYPRRRLQADIAARIEERARELRRGRQECCHRPATPAESGTVSALSEVRQVSGTGGQSCGVSGGSTC